MPSINHYNISIAGAGPAGCAAAIRLRQLNYSVCLIDDVKENEFKIGESLPGAAMRLLRRLGISHLNELLATSEYSSCLANVSAWGTDQWTYKDSIGNPDGGGWHLLRHKFDAALRKLAMDNGVHFYQGKIGTIDSENSPEQTNSIHQFTFKTQHAHLPERVACDWLIDATGRAAAVLRQFNVQRQYLSKQMAAATWLPPNTNDVDHTTRIKSVKNGWWYSARLPDYSRVLSFHGLPEAVAQFVKSRAKFTNAVNKCDILKWQIKKEDLQQKIIARDAGVSKAEEVVQDNWLAIGDAALSFDPLSSQGMFFALYSGVRGAETVVECLKSVPNKNAILQSYREKIENVFEANQRARRFYYSGELRFINNEFWRSAFGDSNLTSVKT